VLPLDLSDLLPPPAAVREEGASPASLLEALDRGCDAELFSLRPVKAAFHIVLLAS